MSACIACRQSAQHRSGTSSTYSYPSLQFFAFAFPLKLFQVINIKHMRTHSSLLYFRVYFHFNEDICMCKYKFTHCSLCGGATADRWYLVCECVCVDAEPTCHIVGDRAYSVHTYIVFSIYQSVFHCPSIMPLLPLCAVVILANAFLGVQCLLCGPFAFFCHCCRLVWKVWEVFGGLGADVWKQMLFVLNHIANDARVASVCTKHSIFYLYPIVWVRTFYGSFRVSATCVRPFVYCFPCLRLCLWVGSRSVKRSAEFLCDNNK